MTTYWLGVFVWALIFAPIYLWFLARVVSSAFFSAKLTYHRALFRHLEPREREVRP
jgi:uncharacterized protein YggT (Ycf19 family)